MKKLSLFSFIISVLLFSCQQKTEISKNNETTNIDINKPETYVDIIQKKDIKLSSDIMTPEVLWSFGRISDIQLSPDQKTIVYGISYYDKEKNSGNRDLYAINLSDNKKTRLTATPFGEYNAIWRPDGKKIAFLSPESGEMQIWEMNPDGSNKKQISDTKGGINGFKYAPDMHKIVFIKEVKLDTTVKDRYTDLQKTSGRLVTHMITRHWDHWVDSYSHIFVADYDGNKIYNSKDIMTGEMWESPVRPWGGMEQINFTPDNKKIAYTCRKKRGKEYALSTNTDIYFYDIETGETKNMTEGMMGYDMEPVFSKNGKLMLFSSMERDGYESDKNRLFLMNLENGDKIDLTANIEQNASHFVFANDNKSAYFISDWHATDEIYNVNFETKEITKITNGIHNYTSVIDNGNQLIATRVSMSKPAEIYLVDKTSGESQEISFNILSREK
jgi:Tol biopolymer transport system component